MNYLKPSVERKEDNITIKIWYFDSSGKPTDNESKMKSGIEEHYDENGVLILASILKR